MKFIANILTEKPINNTELYNVVNCKENLIDNIPTLVIGWEYTKKMFPEANILNWEIDRNTYWTYGKREKRNKYEENMEKFRQLAMLRFIKSVKYKYVNLLISEKEEKDYIISLIKEKNTYIYIANDIVYLLDKINDLVIGFSLRDIDYLKKDRKKILSKIYNNKENIIDIKNQFSWETKNSLYKYSYVVPYLWS